VAGLAAVTDPQAVTRPRTAAAVAIAWTQGRGLGVFAAAVADSRDGPAVMKARITCSFPVRQPAGGQLVQAARAAYRAGLAGQRPEPMGGRRQDKRPGPAGSTARDAPPDKDRDLAQHQLVNWRRSSA
jgi:hypothetical protein